MESRATARDVGMQYLRHCRDEHVHLRTKVGQTPETLIATCMGTHDVGTACREGQRDGHGCVATIVPPCIHFAEDRGVRRTSHVPCGADACAGASAECALASADQHDNANHHEGKASDRSDDRLAGGAVAVAVTVLAKHGCHERGHHNAPRVEYLIEVRTRTERDQQVGIGVRDRVFVQCVEEASECDEEYEEHHEKLYDVTPHAHNHDHDRSEALTHLEHPQQAQPLEHDCDCKELTTDSRALPSGASRARVAVGEQPAQELHNVAQSVEQQVDIAPPVRLESGTTDGELDDRECGSKSQIAELMHHPLVLR
eukprot:4247081-Prymnesium_polylepis.2